MRKEQFVKEVNAKNDFKSLYKFHKVDVNLFDLLINKHFYCAKSDELNDPYDLRYNITDITSTEFELEGLSKYWDSVMNSADYYAPAEISLIKEMKFKTITGDIVIPRVSCFCKTSISNSMWSHYTNNFNGLLLEFDKNFIRKTEGLLLPVIYVQRRRKIKSVEDMLISFYQKTTSWKQEKEFRIISFKKYVQFDPKCLKKIVFGYKVEDRIIEIVKTICIKHGYHRVAFYKKYWDNATLREKKCD